MQEVTEVLVRVNDGEPGATDRLLAIVYDELKRIAAAKMATERADHTLQTTALVNEAYMRLIGSKQAEPAVANDNAQPDWQSRGHFFGAAAEAMRRILIENARSRKCLKRGGDRGRVDLDIFEPALNGDSTDLLALDEALNNLESHDPVKAAVVKMRFFAGMTIDQIAEATGLSEPTVKRHWYYSRAWLKREIDE